MAITPCKKQFETQRTSTTMWRGQLIPSDR
jgi:hypothetical protein